MIINLPKFKRRVLFEKRDGKEDTFLYLAENLLAKIDNTEFPGMVFLFYKRKCYFTYNTQYRELMYSHKECHLVFAKRHKCGHTEVREFFEIMAKKHFGIEAVADVAMPTTKNFGKEEDENFAFTGISTWKRTGDRVLIISKSDIEKHFKNLPAKFR